MQRFGSRMVKTVDLVAVLYVCLGATFFVSAQSGVMIPNHPNCTDPDGWYPIYFVHPTNCSKYFECRRRDAYEFDCPAGLHFNSKINVCDYPVNAQCSPGTTGPPTSPTDTPNPGSTPDPNPGTTPDPNPGTTQGPNPGTTQSPPSGTTEDPNPGTTQNPNPGTTQNPNPGTTQNPNPGTTQNPNPGTTQNPNPGTTQNPNPGTTQNPNPGTTQNPNPGTTQNPNPGTTQGTTQNPNPGTTENPKPPVDPHCPPSGVSKPNYWPNPMDCSKYFGCVDGCVQEFKCPDNLYWHDRLKRCDYHWNCECQCPVIPAAPSVINDWVTTVTPSR
ncbi:proteoglycan 4-like [Anopheles aquasalis]|uniref:proteoglycan 4-like n=1 Tax=Anopheles aquasalis TaxID=42839 RepID=UPI00215A8C3F|nr:proteoglycan 4-like [Anopheles aquasalis]